MNPLHLFNIVRRKLNPGPKVFGLGVSRTGTTSLDRALRALGYRVRGYDQDLLAKWRAGDAAAVMAAIEEYDAFQDWPYPLAYREIMDKYGASALYILTVRRTPEAWLQSYIAHSDHKGPERTPFRILAYGYPQPRGYEAEHIAFYEAHNAAVRAAIAERDLGACFAELCWETGDGWKELCALTGDKPPRTPFPHKNRRRVAA
jgi:hypothetical protein